MICSSSGLGARSRAAQQREPLHGAVALQLSGSPPKPPPAAKAPVPVLSFAPPSPPVPLADANALGAVSSQNHALPWAIFIAGLILRRLISQTRCPT